MKGIVSFDEFEDILMDNSTKYGVLDDKHVMTDLISNIEERQVIVIDKKNEIWSFNYRKNKIGKVNYLRMGEKVKAVKVSTVEYI